MHISSCKSVCKLLFVLLPDTCFMYFMHSGFSVAFQHILSLQSLSQADELDKAGGEALFESPWVLESGKMK